LLLSIKQDYDHKKFLVLIAQHAAAARLGWVEPGATHAKNTLSRKTIAPGNRRRSSIEGQA
jgi:hypothetical protein